jgi:WD40 repeat protein
MVTLSSVASDDPTEVYEVVKSFNAHSEGIIEVAWSPDAGQLATASWDDKIKIWDVSGWTLDTTLTDHTDAVYSIEWSPDGSMLASGSWDDSVIIWDTDTWTSETTLTAPGGNVRSVSWSSDGAYLAAGSDDDTIRIWDTSSWDVDTSYSCTDVPWSIDWSPDDDYIAAGQYDYVVSVWDTTDDALETTLSGPGDNIFSVGFSNGGDTLATGSDADDLRLWDTDTWQLDTVRSLDDRVFSLSWDPTDIRLVTGSWDYVVTFWDTSDWSNIHEETLTDDVYSVRWSPSGDLIACGCDDGSLSIIKRTVNEPPTAVATGDDLLIVDETGSFDGTLSSDSDGTIASYDWDFGDGSPPSTYSTASHSYGAAGTYTVTLKVTDDDGATDTDTLIVSVVTLCQAIDDLIEIVESMNLQNGVDNSLDSKLENAKDALDSLKANEGQTVINKLNAFINEVEAQRDKKLTDDQADILVEVCQWIISNI